MLGWPEILLILTVMLLVVGPSKLPEMAKSLGQAFKEFQSATNNIEKEAKAISSALPDINTPPSMSLSTNKKRALESRQALMAKAVEAPNTSEEAPVEPPRQQVGEAPPPMPAKEPAKSENLEAVAKVLGISVEGRSEEDLKTAIHDRIEGLDEKEV